MNTNISKISNLNAIPKNLLKLFVRAMAKLVLRFNIDRREYLYYQDEQLVLEAQRLEPDATMVEIAVRTGIDRRYIGAFLNGETPRMKPNKLFLILSDIKWTLDKHYYGRNRLPKKGPFRTFQSICEQWSYGTLTYSAILTELVRIGSIIDHGKDVELISVKESDVIEQARHFELSTAVLNRYADTVVHNMQDINSAAKNYQMSAFSTQIAADDLQQLKVEMRKLLKDNAENVIHLLEKYESNVAPDTYPSYGVSVFEFNDNNDEEE